MVPFCLFVSRFSVPVFSWHDT
eukprot:SAG11_NODE_35570_length_266_cov_0.598802_1_plen_21_part_01